MDKGLTILLSLAGLLMLTVILASLGILSAMHIRAIMILSLIYHTGYTIYAMVEWSLRTRIRNQRRGNQRPPHRDQRNPWN